MEIETPKNYYWDSTVEAKAIAITQSTDINEKNRLYMEIRPQLLYMIKSILSKRRISKDWDRQVVDIETHVYTVLTGDTYEPERGKMFSWLSRTVWNEVTINWKKQFLQKNRNDSIDAEESYYELAAANPEMGKEHHHIIDELESRLIYLVPFKFPNRPKDMVTIYEAMYTMIQIFRENEINRVRAFKKEVLNRVPKANPNMVAKLIKLMREEYQFIKNSGY